MFLMSWLIDPTIIFGPTGWVSLCVSVQPIRSIDLLILLNVVRHDRSKVKLVGKRKRGKFICLERKERKKNWYKHEYDKQTGLSVCSFDDDDHPYAACDHLEKHHHLYIFGEKVVLIIEMAISYLTTTEAQVSLGLSSLSLAVAAASW